MKVSSRAGVVWAIAVFLLIGVVFIGITLLMGDETELEDQPTSPSSHRLTPTTTAAVAGA